MGTKKRLAKQSVGCRVTVDIVAAIDGRALAMGPNRAGWLAGVILEALGQEPARSYESRLGVLERWMKLTQQKP